MKNKLVKPKLRRIKRKKFKRNRNNFLNKVNFRLVFLVFGGIFIVLFFILGLNFVLKNTIFSDKVYIHEVLFDENSLKNFDDPYLYKEIINFLSGKNFVFVNMRKAELKKLLLQKYNFVSNVSLKMLSGNKVFVKVDFYNFPMVIRLKSKRFGVNKGKIYYLATGNKLGNTGNIIFLPQYISGNLEMLTGIFYGVSYQKLDKAVSKIKTELSPKRIYFFAGGKRLLAEMEDGKRIFFSLNKDLDSQLKNLQYLRRFYGDYDNVYEVDLSSTLSGEVIVRLK